jgi:sulfonate transport system ATP-binding protein
MSPVGANKTLEVSIKRKTHKNAAGESRLILDAFAFEVKQGEVCALLGPSACGKTTLLRIISGLDKNFEGTVNLLGGTKIGMVFQEPRLLPWRTVTENLRLAGAVSQADIIAVTQALGLSHHLNHFPQELSLGLARRVAIARAFAILPDLLILDEPFVSLDSALAQRLREELKLLVKARKTTALLVTHDVEEAIFLSDKMLIFSGPPGRLIGEIKIEDPRHALSRQALERIKAEIAALFAKQSDQND